MEGAKVFLFVCFLAEDELRCHTKCSIKIRIILNSQSSKAALWELKNLIPMHYYALGLNTIVFFSHAYLHFYSLTKNKTFRKKLLFILRGTMCF